jgi:hypothetical protein
LDVTRIIRECKCSQRVWILLRMVCGLDVISSVAGFLNNGRVGLVFGSGLKAGRCFYVVVVPFWAFSV